ncbi:hypothetical protein THAOC_11285, partial [Thalassiosira oceanica]
MPSSVASAAGPLPDVVTEEGLMSSGHELPDIYTCPLCCLPIALPMAMHSKFKACCMKRVCNGCQFASYQRGLEETCPFCRAPTPDSEAAIFVLIQKRADAKDPAAMEFLAHAYYDGDYDLQPDIPRAIELWTKAANLGDLNAHFKLGVRYYKGDGVEQNVGRSVGHWQHAAIQGHPLSRHNLGSHEYDKENHELGVRHWMISAKMGYERSLNEIKEMFMKGHATKAQYANALRDYQNALEETKSPQREEAKAFFNGNRRQDESYGGAPRALEFPHSAPVVIRLHCKILRRAVAPREVDCRICNFKFKLLIVAFQFGGHAITHSMMTLFKSSSPSELKFSPQVVRLGWREAWTDELGQGVAVLLAWTAQLRATGSRPPASPSDWPRRGIPREDPEAERGGAAP